MIIPGMKRILTSSLFLFLVLPFKVFGGPPDTPPNIIFILTDDQRELLTTERELLFEVTAELERSETSPDDLRTLADSVDQLDELFLLVVVGEFNAGKSALINALLGQAQ